MRAFALAALFVLSACLPVSEADVSKSQSNGTPGPGAALPAAMQGFGLRQAALPRRGNAAIAQDFLDLSFTMESGRAMRAFSRFEGPVRVRLAGDVPPNAATDFDRLLARLRAEAGIDIREVTGGEAEITVQFLPRARIQATYANVACFVAPRVTGWDDFRAKRNAPATDWTTLTLRDRVSIFLPSDGAAQEVRDCLHEELAQALGPINDLYRLSDSVFNDDNFNNTLTGFDMLVLRATYAPDLSAGMSHDEVAARLPGVLARLNPQGEGMGGGGAGATPRAWINAVEGALTGKGPIAQREGSARQAVALARDAGWQDGRMALSLFSLGRLTLSRDPGVALPAFAEAAAIYRALPGGAIQAAHVDMQLAAHALATGNHARALQLAEGAIPTVAAAENAALMATLLMMKAEALDGLGQPAAADAARLDSRGWGRYGFGSDEQVRARMAEIAILARRGG
ncbi:MAG: DUF2927 domain-containing protein [Gemmobacter sp.]